MKINFWLTIFNNLTTKDLNQNAVLLKKRNMKLVKVKFLLLLMLLVSQLHAQQTPPPKLNMEQQLTHFKDKVMPQLKLNEDQQEKLTIAMKDFFSEMDSWHKSHPGERPEKSVMDKLVDNRDASIKQILSAEQFEQFKAMEKKMMENRREKMPPSQ